MTLRTSMVLSALLLCTTPARGDGARVELETYLGGGAGAMSGLIGGGTRIGVPLGQRLVLMAGIEGESRGASGGWAESSGYWVRIPLELKVYLMPPGRGLVPHLRLGGAYARSGSEIDGDETVGQGLEGLGALGLQHFFSERFALGVDVGLVYGRYRFDCASCASEESWRLGLDWRLGLLFRI